MRHRFPRPARLIAAAACLLLGLTASAQESAQEPPPPASGGGPVLLVDIAGAIGPATADHLAEALAEAGARDAALLVLRIDTPGGLVASTRTIIRDILAAETPVAAFVAPAGARAASAGTYILYASHVAAMAPGTNLGAATPIRLGGGDEAGPAESKAVEDAAAWIRGLAELRGRNADWAERAVREAASLTAAQALDQDVVDLVAEDLGQLLARADGMTVTVAGDRRVTLATEGAAVERVEPRWQVRLLSIITNPNVAFLLMTIGVYGLVFELATPGSIGPGVVGVICLVLGLYAFSVLPLDSTGVALVAVGLVCMLAEAFVPSFGLLGIGGAVAFAFGASLLVDAGLPGFGIAWPVIAGVTAASLALTLFVLARIWRSRRRPPATGDDRLRHRPAHVLDWAGDSGTVLVDGERWQATGRGDLRAGASVRIVDRRGLTLVVEPAEPFPQGTEA